MSELHQEKYSIIYNELTKEFPEFSPETIEAALEFKKVAAQMQLEREAIFENFSITPGRFHLLMMLKGEQGQMLSPSEMAKRTNVTRATMTQFVDALEKDEYVRRIDDPKDRRGMLVQLTEKGSEKIREILPHYFKRLAEFTSDFSLEERQMFLELIKKIRPNKLS